MMLRNPVEYHPYQSNVHLETLNLLVVIKNI